MPALAKLIWQFLSFYMAGQRTGLLVSGRPRRVRPRLASDKAGNPPRPSLIPTIFDQSVFYREYHCPICRGYLKQLDSLLDQRPDLGVSSAIAVSGDDAERAAQTVQVWGLGRLAVGDGQTIESMGEWGLFVSKVPDAPPTSVAIETNGHTRAGPSSA